MMHDDEDQSQDLLTFDIFDDDQGERRDTVQLMRVRIGTTQFGVPLGDVVGIESNLALTPIPRAAPWLLGIANLRGEIASVIDLRSLLGTASIDSDGSPSEGSRGLVCRCDDTVYVLAVDEARQIVTVPSGEIRSPSGSFDVALTSCLRGVWVNADSTLFVLDLHSLLRSATVREEAVA